ncbi:hypothetical protein BDV33DRAFT_185272 [Aspergillus novoparasiticus]|uniref:Uncharacterized protein n=1 Tax=Aspergillus novoparasiticus TaxID=986946 RepID=A0A5N6E8T6_9EURO|nr:hypothetical protein BDV33DRAFT_185272 [Aspergillus novoparasiticus]
MILVILAHTRILRSDKTPSLKENHLTMGGLRFSTLFLSFLLSIRPRLDACFRTFNRTCLPMVLKAKGSVATSSSSALHYLSAMDKRDHVGHPRNMMSLEVMITAQPTKYSTPDNHCVDQMASELLNKYVDRVETGVSRRSTSFWAWSGQRL